MGRHSTEKTEKKRKSKSGIKVLITLLFLVIAGLGFYFGWQYVKKSEKTVEVANGNTVEGQAEPEPVKQVQIFNGNTRPVACMIDNHSDAWPQFSINSAYLVYEIIVEGGETRLMALFKGADVEKIGPVRSARHYFIDYAMENDAIYTHFGQSPQAQSDLKKFKIDDINGISEDGVTFWRVKDKNSPHNAVTSTEKLLESAKKKKYKTTSSKESILNYVTDEVNLENGQEAVKITIPHSNLQTVQYLYDEENKVYERYARKKEQTDWTTDTEDKGRQGLKNIGTFDGYYITNGKAIKIKCVKEARDKQTVYKDLDGNKIEVNDGNTFVNICPTNAKVVIEEPESSKQ